MHLFNSDRVRGTLMSTSTTLKDHQELLDLVLEVGDMAKRLEALQYRLTEKLGELADRNGFSLEQVIFGQQADSALQA